MRFHGKHLVAFTLKSRVIYYVSVSCFVHVGCVVKTKNSVQLAFYHCLFLMNILSLFRVGQWLILIIKFGFIFYISFGTIAH